MKKRLEIIDKVWGREWVIVNNDLYCGKLLSIEKGSRSSLHYHKRKTETFYGIIGMANLTIEDKSYVLSPFTQPRTIEPGTKHSFFGITDAVILEVSTPHSDDDVVRETESVSG